MRWKKQNKYVGKLGMAAVEAAMVLPLFVVLALGFIDLSRFFWAQHAVSHAASEGVRMGILDDATDAEVTSVVTTMLSNSGLDDVPVINISGRTTGGSVTINVTLPFNYLFLPSFIDEIVSPVSVSSTAVMQFE